MAGSVTVLLLGATRLGAADGADLVIADFEGASYGDWKTTGEAFGSGPAQGTLPGQMQVDGFKGHGLANSFFGGDKSTGTLSSPPFRIERKFISFLIGGGKDEAKLSLQLLIDGKPARKATGPNDQPGGSERLAPAFWDVTEYAGQLATILIVDQATGGWGHISVDQLVQTDRKPPGLIHNATRTFSLTGKYLNLPVKTGGAKRRMTFGVEGQSPRDFDIELADGEPDWWAYMEIAAYHGRKATLKINEVAEDSAGWQAIDQSEHIKGSESLYQEKLRPQFHFSAQRGWNNDPNGLVFYQGEYHLFFQHNPYGWSWGNMHWGHAVSPDLVHWKQLPEALFPDKLGTMFSGSAVVDEHNTAGFQTGREKPMVCIFTAAGAPFTQGLAFSNDRGRTWTKFEGNPVVPHIAAENRDPKVIWYEREHKWVMALYLDRNDYALFASKDLKKWDKLCEVNLPGASECPEFFEIPLDGDRGTTRWVFYGGNGRYLVGNFDGHKFTSDSGPAELQSGNCWYASQTFNGIPDRDGRRILIPWGTMATPGMSFNQMMGLPVELTLHTTQDGPRLRANPVKELESLRAPPQVVPPQPVNPGLNPLAGIRADLVEVNADIYPAEATRIDFNLRGIPVSYDVQKQELTCKDKKASLKILDGHLRLQFLVDRTSVDIFGNEGRLYMPMGVIMPEDNHALELRATGGTIRVAALRVYDLHSAWR